MGCGPGLADNAVTVQVWPQLSAHRVFSQPSPDDSNGSHDNIEDYTENNSCINPTQYMPDRHPSLVNPNQTSRKYDGWNEKTCGEHHSPQSKTFPAKNERPKTDQSEYATNGKTERP